MSPRGSSTRENSSPRETSPTLLYFLIAYVISWTAWGAIYFKHWSHLAGPGLWVYLAAVFGPHVSAFILTAIKGGSSGLQVFYARMFQRTSIRWSLTAMLLAPAVYLARDLIYVIVDLPHPQFFHQPERTLTMLVLGQLAVIAGEEPGWRGFALPRLIDRFGPITGTIVLGILWAIWHLPLFILPGTAQYGDWFASFLLLLMSWSMVMTLLVLRSRGGIITAMLFHGFANVCDYIFWEPGAAAFALGPWLVAALVAGWMISHPPSSHGPNPA